jgi:O-antigen/teichoic acid export membrane protein
VQNVITHALKFQIHFLVLTTTLIIVFSSPVVLLLFGQEFLPVRDVLPFVVISMSFTGIIYAICTILNGADMPKISLAIVLSGTIAQAMVSIPLIQYFQLFGASIAFLLTAIGTTVISLFAVKKFFSVSLPFRTLWTSLLCAGIISVFSLVIPKTILWMFFGGALLSVVYVAILYVLKEVTPKDIQRVWPKSKSTTP